MTLELFSIIVIRHLFHLMQSVIIMINGQVGSVVNCNFRVVGRDTGVTFQVIQLIAIGELKLTPNIRSS